jgi:cytochrome b
MSSTVSTLLLRNLDDVFGEIDPLRRRDRFTSTRMAKDYVSTYHRLLKTRSSGARLRQLIEVIIGRHVARIGFAHRRLQRSKVHAIVLGRRARLASDEAQRDLWQ